MPLPETMKPRQETLNHPRTQRRTQRFGIKAKAHHLILLASADELVLFKEKFLWVSSDRERERRHFAHHSPHHNAHEHHQAASDKLG